MKLALSLPSVKKVNEVKMVRRCEGDGREMRGTSEGVLSCYDEKQMQCNIAICECRAMLALALLSVGNFDVVNIAILILYAFISQMATIAIIPIHNLREKGI